MKYTRLFTGPDQQSHFEVSSLELSSADIGKITAPIATEKLFFGEFDETEEIDWHNPSVPQYVIMLEGSMEIELGNGTKQIFKTGEILLAEDISGQGHRTKAASKGKQRYMVIPLKGT